MMDNGTRRAGAPVALLLASSLALPLAAGCGNNTSNAGSNAQPPLARQGGYNGGGYNAPRQQAPQQRQGMSTGQKVALLTGAAALWYMYNRNKNNQGTGENGKYYRSKNGRIYYRDAKGNAVYVTPPAGGIQVPSDVAERYNRAAQSGNFGSLENDSFGGSGYSSGNNGGGLTGGYQGDGYNGGVPAGAGAYGNGGGSALPPGPRGGGF